MPGTCFCLTNGIPCYVDAGLGCLCKKKCTNPIGVTKFDKVKLRQERKRALASYNKMDTPLSRSATFATNDSSSSDSSMDMQESACKRERFDPESTACMSAKDACSSQPRMESPMPMDEVPSSAGGNTAASSTQLVPPFISILSEECDHSSCEQGTSPAEPRPSPATMEDSNEAFTPSQLELQRTLQHASEFTPISAPPPVSDIPVIFTLTSSSEAHQSDSSRTMDSSAEFMSQHLQHLGFP